MPNDAGPPPLVIIGNPDSKRIRHCTAAAQSLGFDVPQVISYGTLLSGADVRSQIQPGSLIRIESPGESWEIERGILQLGAEPLEHAGGAPVSAAELNSREAGRGEIHHPHQWYRGFDRLLLKLDWQLDEVPDLKWMSAPGEVVTMFDKLACRSLWEARGLPMPRSFEGISRYDQLRGAIPHRHARVFLKLRYGYSAMGAVALEWRGPLVRAITTVEVVSGAGRPRLFLSKKVRVLTREFEIAWLIDTLGMEGIVVEEWLPKARWMSCPFDLRVVVIGGRASHAVGRAGTTPFTNLNLDSRRVAPRELAARLGESWQHALSLCEQAAQSFPNSTSIGMDLLVRPCRRRFAILEANAFGDYLPNLLVNGRDTYTAALERFAGRRGALTCST